MHDHEDGLEKPVGEPREHHQIADRDLLLDDEITADGPDGDVHADVDELHHAVDGDVQLVGMQRLADEQMMRADEIGRFVRFAAEDAHDADAAERLRELARNARMVFMEVAEQRPHHVENDVGDERQRDDEARADERDDGADHEQRTEPDDEHQQAGQRRQKAFMQKGGEGVDVAFDAGDDAARLELFELRERHGLHVLHHPAADAHLHLRRQDAGDVFGHGADDEFAQSDGRQGDTCPHQQCLRTALQDVFVDERTEIQRLRLVGEDVVEHEFAGPRVDGAEDEAEDAEENQREDILLMFAKGAQISFQIIRERFFAGAVARHGGRAAEAAVMAAEAAAHSAAEASAAHAHAAAEAAAHPAARPAGRRAVRSFLSKETA